jgi:hypothetical protein
MENRIKSNCPTSQSWRGLGAPRVTIPPIVSCVAFGVLQRYGNQTCITQEQTYFGVLS